MIVKNEYYWFDYRIWTILKYITKLSRTARLLAWSLCDAFCCYLPYFPRMCTTWFSSIDLNVQSTFSRFRTSARPCQTFSPPCPCNSGKKPLCSLRFLQLQLLWSQTRTRSLCRTAAWRRIRKPIQNWACSHRDHRRILPQPRTISTDNQPTSVE
mgnify:CR=1 FL=1